MWWKSSIAAMALALLLVLAGCGTDDIDISGYADETVAFSGVKEEDCGLTIADLKGMDCITREAESTSDKIGRVKATGPTLDTVLRRFGHTQEEVNAIHVTARDGYDVKIGSDVLASEEIILAFGIDGKPLDEEAAPVRIVIPDSDSAYWIRQVEGIGVEMKNPLP